MDTGDAGVDQFLHLARGLLYADGELQVWIVFLRELGDKISWQAGFAE